MPVRGVRGATTVRENTSEEIISRTMELLESVIRRNEISMEDVATAVFSVTDDLDADFPAVAARRLGWIYTPLLCTREIPVPGSLPLCVRVLLVVNSEKKQEEMMHVYLYGARKLRPDLESGEGSWYTSEK